LFVFAFGPQNEGTTLPSNVDGFLPEYTALHPRRQHCSSSSSSSSSSLYSIAKLGHLSASRFGDGVQNVQKYFKWARKVMNPEHVEMKQHNRQG
jgi:hypothetical protein